MRASVWLKAIQNFSPDIYEATQKAFKQKTTDAMFIRPEEVAFKSIPSNSIDYAVIEKCPSSNFDIKMLALDANWSDLVQLFVKLDLEKLSTYEGPTQKRLYDGAAIANLKVTRL